MALNKVRARIIYKTGVYVSYAIADDSLNVGDKARCRVLSGYETECVITEICKKNVADNGRHARIVGTAQKISKEDMVMMDEVFATVFVNDGRGYIKRCRSLMAIDKGVEVAYEGNDGRLHVAMVEYSVPAGTPYDPLKGVDVAGFIACPIDRGMLAESKKVEKEYADTLNQLKARKKQFEEHAIWEMLAEKDPAARELLNKLDSMKGGRL